MWCGGGQLDQNASLPGYLTTNLTIKQLDPPRPDTKETIAQCALFGVRVKMITGDHLVAHSTPYTLHPTPYTLHPTPYTLLPKLSTASASRWSLATTWYPTLHPTPYTLHPR